MSTHDASVNSSQDSHPATRRWRRFGLGLFVLAAILAGPDAYTAETSKPAPAISLPQLQHDGVLTLESLRGRVVLVDFWASWCGPCRESLPQYQKMRDLFRRSDFEVFAVSLDENRDDALAFLKKMPLTFPLLHDPDSTSARAYGLKGMPSSYLIDRQGNLRFVHIGFQMKDLPMLKQMIADLVIEPTAEPSVDAEPAHAD